MDIQSSRYLAGCFYTDTTGLLESNFENSTTPVGVTSTLSAAVNAGSKGQWLVLVRPQGIVEVRDWLLMNHDDLIAHAYLEVVDPAQVNTRVLCGWLNFPSKRTGGFT